MNKTLYRLFGESVQTRTLVLIMMPFDLFERYKQAIKK
jgi:hypothetical protein